MILGKALFMAPKTYYYLISTILLIGVVLFIADLLFLRAKGKTTFGLTFKSGTPEYKRLVSLASNRNIGLWVLFAILLLVNFLNSANVLRHLHTANGQVVLIGGPIVVLLGFLLASLPWRKGRSTTKKTSQNDDGL